MIKPFNDNTNDPGYLKVGSSSYPSISTGHELTIDNVELHMYLKALETVDGISLSAESKDKKYFSITKEESDSIELQNQENYSSQENNEGVNNNQNMSLPPHWRQSQPIQREESSDDEPIEEEVINTVFKATNVKNDKVKKLIISDEIIVSLENDELDVD
jgi:NACalpha-BTF3-like transcription factor